MSTYTHRTYDTPTADETLGLITEGQALKQRLRAQYADQIDEALRAQTLTVHGNKSGTNSVEQYYFGASGASPQQQKSKSGEAGDSNATTVSQLMMQSMAKSNKEGGVSTSSVHNTADGAAMASLSPSKRDVLILQGYLPATAAAAGSPLAPAHPTTADAIRSTTQAIADADARERRLKALIASHDPVRASLRLAQQRAIEGLISATEASLAWEVRLAAEEANPSSPIHDQSSGPHRAAGGNKSPTKEGDETARGGEEGENRQQQGSPAEEAASTPSSSTAAAITNTLHTSPFRENGSASERAALERRLELLVKLGHEHDLVMRCEKGSAGVYDERLTVVEAAVDVSTVRDLKRVQAAEAEERRLFANTSQ